MPWRYTTVRKHVGKPGKPKNVLLPPPRNESGELEVAFFMGGGEYKEG
jgi:hypothetical protein